MCDAVLIEWRVYRYFFFINVRGECADESRVYVLCCVVRLIVIFNTIYDRRPVAKVSGGCTVYLYFFIVIIRVKLWVSGGCIGNFIFFMHE